MNGHIMEFKTEIGMFVYNFAAMSIAQVLAAETLFKMYGKHYSLLPSTPSELETAMSRNILSKAFGALLVRKGEKGDYENFDPAGHSGYEAMNYLTGADYSRLEECRKDFFQITGIAPIRSIMQPADVSGILKSMDRELLREIIKEIKS